MNTDEKRYEALISRWFKGDESDEDAYALHALLNDPQRDAELAQALEQAYHNLEAPGYPEANAGELAEKIVALSPPDNGPAVETKMRHLSRWAIAASVLLVIGLSVWLLVGRQGGAGAPETAGVQQEIAPGKTGALLTLADGSQVSLDTVANGAIALQGGVTARVTNGVLTYEGAGDETVFNTLTTPKGRQYHLTLPDGSGIWLNAASAVRYPTRFSGKERRVEIRGEAYFEVVANKAQPFIVEVDGKAMVQVLGTHFNIHAYANEAQIATTLLEGSILTAPGKQITPAAIKLRPGQQALLSRKGDGSMRLVKDADIDNVMAWKNGLFNFNGATLEEVMKQLERWYDIEVVYENGIPERKLTGKMTKDIPLEGLLVGLKELGIHCRLEGRKLIVLP